MAYIAKIILDSINPGGNRLTTWQLTYPRFVHAEFMTHRLFSRNAASSRAIPTTKIIDQVKTDPAMPVEWGRNQSGMQARELLGGEDERVARAHWLSARDNALLTAEAMLEMKVHKQIANRLLEPFMWITVICSATEFDNFFNLRCHPDAQPEIKHLADMMQREYFTHEPTRLTLGQWHAPYADKPATMITPDDLKISVARCAGVSYLRHEVKRDSGTEIALHDRLATSGHWSPFEHVACALETGNWSGNFRGWAQYRKSFQGEHKTKFIPNLQEFSLKFQEA